MEYDLIAFIQSLLGGGIKGYISSKPEGTPYPAFVIEVDSRRGEDIHGTGKGFGYEHNVQINVIDPKFKTTNSHKLTLTEVLDGFRGELGSHNVIDCRLSRTGTMKNQNKNYEAVLMFSFHTI